MNPEKFPLKSSLEGILAFQDDLAKLYEQAAKEGSDRTHYQSFRQLASLNAQHATELRAVLESQPETLDLPLGKPPQEPWPAALQAAGEDEAALMAQARATETALLSACAGILQAAQLPASIQHLLERQTQASQQALSLLQSLP